MSYLGKHQETLMISTTTKLITNRAYGISILILGFIAISITQSQIVEAQEQQQQQLPTAASALSGEFVGAGDGTHHAEGVAKEISTEDGRKFIRFENFEVTNGPNLFVYLATDKNVSDFVDLGVLKANIGNQNYEIPDGTDLAKYKTVVIWCKAFSVLFGSADLKESIV
jgi:Electron transfer DM13